MLDNFFCVVQRFPIDTLRIEILVRQGRVARLYYAVNYYSRFYIKYELRYVLYLYYSRIRRLTAKARYTCGHNAVGEVTQETARGHARNTGPSIHNIQKVYSTERRYIKNPPENTRDANTMGKEGKKRRGGSEKTDSDTTSRGRVKATSRV